VLIGDYCRYNYSSFKEEILIKGFGVIRPLFKSAVVSISLIIILALGINHSLAPKLPDRHSAFAGYSLDTTYNHLKQIAQAPHPTGSTQHDQVRSYIVNEIKEMGLDPLVQKAEISTTDNVRSTDVLAVTLNNIMVKLEGQSTTRSVLIMAHYDSEPYSPGANDDGVAVAAMLETMNSFKQGEPLKNDVIFLFTDAEELGLLGAKVFWERHAWAKDVGIVLNFEARGSEGASLMFESSPQNGWIINEFAKSITYPVANSLMGDIYELKSNDTDMTISNESGVSGLNFAYVDGWTSYHNSLDNLEHISMDTLFHHNDNMYVLAKHFSNTDLTRTKANDHIYFNLWGSVIHYPKSWATPLTVFVLIPLSFAFFWGVRRKAFTINGILTGIISILCSIILSIATTYGLWKAVKILWGEKMITDTDAVFQSGYYHTAFILLTAAISFFIFSKIRTKVNLLEFVAGSTFLASIVLILLTVFLPGGTYLLAWPLLSSTACIFYILFPNKRLEALVHPIGLILCAAPILVLTIPVIYLALIFSDMEIAALLMGSVVLVLSFCWPAFESLLIALNKKFVITSLLVAAVFILSLTVVEAKHDENFPKGNNLFYTFNADTNKAYWVSKFKPDAWVSQYIKESNQQNIEHLITNKGKKQTVWVDDAPVIDRAGPQANIIKDEVEGSLRKIELKVTSPREARFLMLQVENVAVENILINGVKPSIDERDLDQPDDKWRLKYINFPKEGIMVTLEVKHNDSIQLRLLDGSEGLPEFDGLKFEPRPKTMMPKYGFDGMTMVSNSFKL
jgi:hypothetical protein